MRVQAYQDQRGEVSVWEDRLLELVGLHRQAGFLAFQVQGFLEEHHLDFRGGEDRRLGFLVLHKAFNHLLDFNHRLASSLRREDGGSHRQDFRVQGSGLVDGWNYNANDNRLMGEAFV